MKRESSKPLVGISQYTIVDMNDFQSGDIPPSSPTVGTVWLDMSVKPPVFKVWNGSEWIIENDWNEKVNGLEDSINETKSNLEGTQTEVRLLKNSVDLKADTSYVDRVKTELTLGGKNKMPFTLFAMENFTSYWTTSHNDIATMSLVDYNFGVEGNDDYFIAGKKVLNFSVNSIKATEQQINYSTCNVIDDKKFIKLKPNKDYTFSSWILKNNFCEKFKFVVFNKATNKIHATSSLFSAESDKFKRYALTFTTDSTEEYCVIIYNYPKSGASGNSNVYLYNMIVEEGEASDVWSPCIDDVGSSSIAYIEESLKQLKSNLKVEDDKITASVSKIKENTETINGEVQKNKKWIENAQLAIDSGSIVGTVSNYLPGADNLMPYTYMNIKDIEKSWSVSPKGTITKRIYDFGAVSSQDNFLYGKNVLMISCTPLEASSIEDSLLTLTVAPEKRDIALEVNTKYTISYYLYITDRIKSVKCQIWNKTKNTSLNSTIEEDSIVTEYTEHFVKVEVPFTTTVDDTVYYPKFIIEMKKDLLRDANIYLADMMIQKGSVNIAWMPNKEDSEKYVDATMTEKMVEVNEKFLEYGKELKNLDTYMKGAFKDGIIDSTEAENIRESLRYLDIEKRAIDAQYNEIMSNTSLVDNENVLTNKNNIEDEVSTYGAGPTVSDVTVIEAFRNGRFKLRYKVGNELPNEETTHFISKNGANYESVDAIKYGDYYEAIGTGLAPGDNKVSIKVINSAGQNIFSNITVTIKENSKAHLTFLKGEYNTKYNELVALINRVLEAGKVTEQDKNDIDSAFNAYGEKLSQFHAAFNSAIDAIAESKVSALTQQLDTKMAQFKVTVDGISSTVKKTETITGEILGDLSNINGSIGDLTTSVGVAKENAQKAQDAADSAKGAADTANRLVSDISNDNRFTPSEKQSAKLEWDVIVGEKSGIIESANKYSVSTTDYLAKYDALSSYITPLLSNLTDTSDINGGIFRNKFKDYYNSKQAILNNISSEAKSLVEVAERLANDAQGTADSAIKAVQTAQSTAETAKSSAQTANNKLGEIASDSKLTPSEKQNTKLEWDKIVGEKDKIISEATKFSVGTTTYTNNYNTLNSYITPLLSDLNSTSDIVGATFRSNFANYYNARQDVLNAITTKAKELASAAQGTANNAQAAADKAKEDAKAAQSTADTAKSTADTAQKSAQTANNTLKDIADDNKITPVEKQNTKLEWDKIVGEKSKIVSEATKFGVSLTTYNNAYSSLETYITPILSSLTSTSAITGTEFRTKFSTYYNARQDVLNGISSKAKSLADTAQGAAQNAQSVADAAKQAAQNAQSTADTAKTSAQTANNTLKDIADDNKITPTEKQSTKLEWDKIVGEKPKIVSEAGKFGVSLTSYNSAYSTLETYITPILSSLTSTSSITGTTFRSNFANYYNARQDVLNGITTKAKELAGTAQSTANNAQTAADAAQKAADAANALATTAKSTAETAKSSAQTANNKLGEIASDSKLTPSEKQSTKLEWDKIVGEKTRITNEATKFGVSTTTYTNNYNTLNSYITPLLSDLNSTSDIVGTTFRSNFANYYNARQDVLNLISSKAKTLADNAQTAADNANKQVSALGSRVSTVEQKVEADNITNVVRQHTSYKNDLNAKANKTDVYTKNEIDNKSYQTQSQVQQTVNGLQVKVEDSGGYNLVKNSCGAGGDKGWYAPDGVTISVNRDLARLVTAGANTGLKIQHSSSSNVIVYSDRFPLKPNSKYIISAWCDCSNIDSALFMVAGSDTLYSNDTTESYTWYKRAPIVTPGSKFTKIFLAFETTANAKSAYVRIQIGPRTSTSSVGMLSFTKLLVTEGELDFDWSAHPDEVYAGIVEIGKEGVTVRRDDSGGYTVLDNKSLSVVEKGATIASFGENSSIPELRSGTIYAEDIKSSNLINTQEAITLYVDMTNGSDENDGLSSSSPLKTIQEALDRLNKCLIEDSVIINVTGTGNQSIKAWGFIGSGELNIIFSQTARLYTNTFDFYCCTCFIRVNGNKDGTEGKNSAQIIQQDNGDLFYIMACTYVHIKSSCIVGQKSGQAITSIYGSHVFVEQCEVDRFSTCFLAKSAGIISVKNCIGSDDTYVAGGNNGGIIFLEAWENNSIVPNYTSTMYMGTGAAQVHRAGLPEGKGVKKSGVIYPPTYVPPSPPAATQYTKSWTPTKIYSDETLNGWSDRAELIQGYYSGWGTGRWTGYIKFNDANIRDTISGATNLSGKLYLKRRSSSHGVYSGAILALYGSDGTAIDTSSKFDLGTGKWITLSAAVVGKIQSGAIKYFYVKYDSSTQNRYIKFESNVTLQLSYKK